MGKLFTLTEELKLTAFEIMALEEIGEEGLEGEASAPGSPTIKGIPTGLVPVLQAKKLIEWEEDQGKKTCRSGTARPIRKGTWKLTKKGKKILDKLEGMR